MGQQQRLLLILSSIVVGFAIIAGMQLATSYDAKANEDALRTDILFIAARAQEWYRKPKMLGGGGRTFSGLKLADLHFPKKNDNGIFSVPTSPQKTQFEIIAIGKTDNDNDDTPLKLVAVIGVDSVKSITVTSR